MKLQKIAKIVKEAGQCFVVNVDNGDMWIGTDRAMYRLRALPQLEHVTQVEALLGTGMDHLDFEVKQVQGVE